MGAKKGHIPWNKGNKISIICKECKIKFQVHPYREKTAKFCSYDCLGKNKIGHTPWNKGKRFPQVFGENNRNWKGDKVGYFALHSWVKRNFGIPDACEFCRVGGKKNGRSWSIHWANKSGKYLRDRNDWLRLCMSCHRKYDFPDYVPWNKGIKWEAMKGNTNGFKKGHTPWNKGKKGVMPIPWNKKKF